MSTKTTINPAADTYIQSYAATTNYGAGSTLWLGQRDAGGNLYHGLFEYDVSAFTKPADIVAATFELTEGFSSGSAHTMTIARLTQSFTEVGATWNTYDGSNAWTTAGAAADAATTEPTYTLTLGDDVVVDIKDLVVDAILRRSGTLRLVVYMTATGSAGRSRFSADEAGSDEPELSVTVADRVVWTGDRDSDANQVNNWSTGAIPTVTDYAIFNDGAVNCTSGSISCHSLYIGKQYKGNIEPAVGLLAVAAEKIICDSKYSKVKLDINAATSTVAEVRILNTGRQAGSFILDGKYSAIVNRTSHNIDLQSSEVTTIDAHGSGVSLTASARVTTAIATRSEMLLDAGATNVTAANSARITLDGTDTGQLVVAGSGKVKINSAGLGVATLWDGRISYQNNDEANLSIDEIDVYPGGTLDTRTGSTTFNTLTDCDMFGGRLLLDAAQDVTIT